MRKQLECQRKRQPEYQRNRANLEGGMQLKEVDEVINAKENRKGE